MNLVNPSILELAITKALRRSFQYRSIEDVYNADLERFSEAVVDAYIARIEEEKQKEVNASLGVKSHPYDILPEALELLAKAEADYRGMAHIFATYGYRASAKEAIETADYLKAFLERAA